MLSTDSSLWCPRIFQRMDRVALAGAKLAGASLREAYLSGANLKGAQLAKVLSIKP